jgi:hypothetical protein
MFYQPQSIVYLAKAKKIAAKIANDNHIQLEGRKYAALLFQALNDISSLEQTKNNLKALTTCECSPIEEIASYCYALTICCDLKSSQDRYMLQEAAEKLTVASNFNGISNYIDLSGESQQEGNYVRGLAGILLAGITCVLGPVQPHENTTITDYLMR